MVPNREASVPLSALRQLFTGLKQARRVEAMRTLELVGSFGEEVIRTLKENCVWQPIEWRGVGSKEYRVLARPGTDQPFSRPLNSALVIEDEWTFEEAWDLFLEGLQDGMGAGVLAGATDATAVNRLFYTVVAGYAALVDLLGSGDRGGPGVLLEMAVGPTISALSGRPETGEVTLPVPDSALVERVKTDLTFLGGNHPALVVPTKISTRERISQAYVHQRILDSARPGEFRSILVACSENNVMAPRGTARQERTSEICWVQDTLVPGTISLYQRYIAELAGIYYLDPPVPYSEGTYPGMPVVRTFGDLLKDDLAGLLV